MKASRVPSPLLLCCFASVLWAADQTAGPSRKAASSLFPADLVANARANAAKYDWAKEVSVRIVAAAKPYTQYSDDELWSMMFGATIERSWMVWSNGHCPACGKGVPMYNWEIDALRRPWKVRCPHCKELFPKNDFHAFYTSGLDEHGVFDPERADRKLLFNTEHPDPSDPKHRFGVDDGTGYVEGNKRWRFIGCYLIYGHWKQLVVGGISKLADAYVVTGDPNYAHKAGILLDRVADLYPAHDFGKQGWVYERRGDRGYVSTWHDACEEFRAITLAYDMVFDALKKDQSLVRFLSAKAKEVKLRNPKTSFADIQRNIENGILRDTIKNRGKIQSNYPRTDVALLVAKAVLAWPHNRAEINGLLDGILKKATAVDGMTGEKGLSGYSVIGPRAVSELLGRLARLERTFLADVYKRHPRLHDMFRFHIDMQCLGEYYPRVGDTGHFACKYPDYLGVSLDKPGSLSPSGWTFLWRMFQLTRDPAFVQIVYRENGDKVEGLPYDILIADPQAMQEGVAKVVAEHGPRPKLDSVNKREWRIAVLRTGRKPHRRAAWVDYDSHGGHSHYDGLNVGLFAKGLDLMPDYGYPPVQFGGWGSPRARWYTRTAAHNTVVVDGQDQARTVGACTLWAIGDRFRAIRTSGPKMYKVAKQYERTVAVVDVSEADSYLLDVFRVVGGTDHARFMTGHFGTVSTPDLDLKPSPDYGHNTEMRNFRTDPSPNPGWTADWKVKDLLGFLPEGSDVHLRLTELTHGASASLCDAWIVAGIYNSAQELWVPRVLVRRRAKQAPLASTFVSVIEPYEKASNLAGIRRLSLKTEDGQTFAENHVAVEVCLADGRRDVLLAMDTENPLARTPAWTADAVVVQPDSKLRFQGELLLARLGKGGRPVRLAACKPRRVEVVGQTIRPPPKTEYVEITWDAAGKASVVRAVPAGSVIEINAEPR